MSNVSDEQRQAPYQNECDLGQLNQQEGYSGHPHVVNTNHDTTYDQLKVNPQNSGTLNGQSGSIPSSSEYFQQPFGVQGIKQESLPFSRAPFYSKNNAAPTLPINVQPSSASGDIAFCGPLPWVMAEPFRKMIEVTFVDCGGRRRGVIF